MIRERSIEILDLISPFFVLTDLDLHDLYVRHLALKLVNKPDDIMILVERDGDTLLGFIVLQNPGPMFPFINLEQVYSTLPGLGDSLLARAVSWAMSLDKTAIRAETRRNTGSIYRAYGFTPVSSILQFKLTDDLVERVEDSNRKAVQWAVSLIQTSQTQ